MDENNFSFVVYMIHACADRWNVAPSKVYQDRLRARPLVLQWGQDCTEYSRRSGCY